MDVKSAQEVAQARIMEISGLTHPQWEGAYVIAPQPYCNLRGQVICYMFTIQKDNKALGHILIGSYLYNHSLFQASDELPPKIPSSVEVSTTINKSLESSERRTTSNEPIFFFYSGGYHGFYSVYDVKGQEVAVNLYSGKVCLLEDLEFGLLSPEKYRAVKEKVSRIESRSSGYKAIPVYLYDSYNDCTNPSKGCGPASGAMIASYYESLGYSNFPEWGDYPDDDELDEAYEDLYDTMGTGFFGTAPYDFGPGFVEYAGDNGYYGFDDTFFFTRSIDDYWEIVDYIDDNTPMGGLVLSIPLSHWYAVRGYDYDTGSSSYEMICNSPNPNNGSGSVSWIGFWEKAWNNMVAIED